MCPFVVWVGFGLFGLTIWVALCVSPAVVGWLGSRGNFFVIVPRHEGASSSLKHELSYYRPCLCHLQTRLLYKRYTSNPFGNVAECGKLANSLSHWYLHWLPIGFLMEFKVVDLYSPK